MAGNKTLQSPKIPSPVSQYDPVVKEDLSTLLEYQNSILDSGNKPNLSGFTFDNSFLTQSKFISYPAVFNPTEIEHNASAGGGGTEGYTGFGDEITNITVGTNGLILFGYLGMVKSEGNSLALKAKMTVQLNGVGVKTKETSTGVFVSNYVETQTTDWNTIVSDPGCLKLLSGSAANLNVTTGLALGGDKESGGQFGGMCPIWVAAGTYTLTVKYSPSRWFGTPNRIWMKERKMWAYSLG